MTLRTLIVLAVALVVLSLAALYGQRRTEPPALAEDRLLLPDLEASLDDVDRVTLEGAGGEAVATLQRRQDGWIVAEKDGYPADLAKIREALLGLSEARIVEQKTANADYYERLGVEPVEEDTASGIAVTAQAGDAVLPTVIVGDAAGTGYRYVRLADDATSYMVDGELELPRNASEWVDPTIVDIRGPRIRQVTIEHPDGETVRISKADAQQANFSVEAIPEGRELLYPGVANVVGNALRELRLEDVESADGGGSAEAPEEASADTAEEEPVRTTYRTFDGLVVTVSGVERDDGAWIELRAAVDPERAADGDADSAGSVAAGLPEGAVEDGESTGGGAEESSDDDAADVEPATADAATEAAPGAGEGDAAGTGVAADPAAEAEAINERVAGWRYLIPSYQFDQMTRRMSDLLKAAE